MTSTKVAKNPNVLQDWLLHKCSWRQQTVLLTALRGPDGLPKHNNGKILSRFLRSCILRDATPRRGTFMGVQQGQAKQAAVLFLADPDGYPHHYIMHLLHSAEILGYKHSDIKLRKFWNWFYLQGCLGLHMNPESEQQMDLRLKDDV